METFGQAVRRLRGPRSLRELSRIAHVDAGHLSRIEAGKRKPTIEVAVALDEALNAGGMLRAFVMSAASDSWELDGGLWRPQDSERLAAFLLEETPTAENAVELAHQWLIAEPPQIYEVRAGRRIGIRTVRKVEQRVHQLRQLDDHVGGTDTYAMVNAELAATTQLLRDGAYTERIGRRLLVAIGELGQLAGWVASDSGRYAQAKRFYIAGMRASHAGGDTGGAANNLSSLAYQEANVGNPREAERLARSAYAGAKSSGSATTRALMAERIAWAAARTGDAASAERALGLVETEYGRRKPEKDPIWTYWLNEDEIEVMAGRVWTQLHRPLRAVPLLERAVADYGADTGRETSLYLSWLAESLLQANEVERSADTATRSLRLSRAAGSVRADDRVLALATQLRKHRGNEAVDAFLEELKEIASL